MAAEEAAAAARAAAAEVAVAAGTVDVAPTGLAQVVKRAPITCLRSWRIHGATCYLMSPQCLHLRHLVPPALLGPMLV